MTYLEEEEVTRSWFVAVFYPWTSPISQSLHPIHQELKNNSPTCSTFQDVVPKSMWGQASMRRIIKNWPKYKFSPLSFLSGHSSRKATGKYSSRETKIEKLLSKIKIQKHLLWLVCYTILSGTYPMNSVNVVQIYSSVF